MEGISLVLLKSWPHSSQNLLPTLLEALHSGQVTSNLCPHSLQNLAPSIAFWCPPFKVLSSLKDVEATLDGKI
jgi:hypothetical protein